MTDKLTVASRILELARRAGVEYIFITLGNDHPAFIEAFAQLGPEDLKIVVCPHEMTGLTAAHGYAMMTRKPQMVLCHVDVGTANLVTASHNACRGRIPAIIIAGRSGVTVHGELTGSRTEPIQYTQDTTFQTDLVRPYMKWIYELRQPQTVESILLRGRQIASSEPQGPVYISGAREIWEMTEAPLPEDLTHWPATPLGHLPEQAAKRIAAALVESKRPLVISSYYGRNPEAVAALVALSEKVGLAVTEALPQYVAFPGSHPNHLGYVFGKYVDEADFILLLDVDVPWVPSVVMPAKGTRIFHIDCDPLKAEMGHWHFPAEEAYGVDSHVAIKQILSEVGDEVKGRDERMAWLASHGQKPSQDAGLTSEFVATTLRELSTERSIFVLESPSATELTSSYLRPDRPGSFVSNGGTGLGWGINAAIGVKLANPESDVVAIIGDGSFVFGVPTSAYWVAHTYSAPFLTVIENNGGWNSPKFSADLVHPDGPAEKSDKFYVTMTRGAKLPETAAAAGGDAAVFRVTERSNLRETLQKASEIVRSGRCAVVEVLVKPISLQKLP